MTPDIDPTENETVAAKVLKMLDRKGYYHPRDVSIETVPSQAPVASHNEGVAQEVTHAMSRSDSYPVRYVVTDETVTLEVDSQRFTAATIRRLDENQLEWEQQRRL